MRILFLTSGPDVPSTRFRVLQYVPHLVARGHTCVVAHSRPPKYRGWALLGNRLSDVPRLCFRLFDCLWAATGRFDVVVVERELFSSRLAFVERLLRRIARRLVLDVDDGIFLQHPQKFERTAASADAVIAGSPPIAEYVRNITANVTVIPTSLDLERYRRAESEEQRAESRMILGWTGQAVNFPDLKIAEPALCAVRADCEFRFRVIAERAPKPDEFSLPGDTLEFVPWNKASEIADLSRLDVGLMPLSDTPWQRYKCGLKLLQYMALGIPAVASPVGVNTEIVTSGQNGLLADTPQEWEASLRQLIGDAGLRERIAAAGRETVEARYSVAGNVGALEQVLAGER